MADEFTDIMAKIEAQNRADYPEPVSNTSAISISASTVPQQQPQPWTGGKWVKGQSGNPAGRPKGSRDKITKLMFDLWHAKLAEQGEQILENVIATKPEEFFRIAAKMMPKQFEVAIADRLADLDEDRLHEMRSKLHRQIKEVE